ncbi:YihY/virulence factor BrkB family protein [Streptomyces sp. GQFP]|uniref:YihY/virulence factor BrkB family protein n=1 Tax=Streptomyces sp. GQFP TaxID=2907545 RepID=UPI001F459F8B|nr:YihY/virulence factor BrkB family protein [Streptomyces sp. GQFP]UIX32854.1 YihY/virulence factor BrkB family protein [Streptomyces sp. GQFP]
MPRMLKQHGHGGHGGHDGTPEAGPDTVAAPPPRPSWWTVLKGTAKEFGKDELADRAAALTYYGILALFPALMLLVSVLGLMGRSASQRVLDNIQSLAPGSAREVLHDAVSQMEGTTGIGSVMAALSLFVAVWSASGYVAAFIRSADTIYDVPKGRPVWKVLPVRVGVTLALMVLAVVSAVTVVFTGDLAQQVGTALGFGDTALAVWSIAKWPGLAVVVTVMIAILYWAAPHPKGRGFRWITPGSFLALAIWMAASGGFAVYLANFASYNRTYGTFAGVIIFLIWLWITNLAILLGLECDAELTRQRGGVRRGYGGTRTPDPLNAPVS